MFRSWAGNLLTVGCFGLWPFCVVSIADEPTLQSFSFPTVTAQAQAFSSSAAWSGNGVHGFQGFAFAAASVNVGNTGWNRSERAPYAPGSIKRRPLPSNNRPGITVNRSIVTSDGIRIQKTSINTATTLVDIDEFESGAIELRVRPAQGTSQLPEKVYEAASRAELKRKHPAAYRWVDRYCPTPDPGEMQSN